MASERRTERRDIRGSRYPDVRLRQGPPVTAEEYLSEGYPSGYSVMEMPGAGVLCTAGDRYLLRFLFAREGRKEVVTRHLPVFCRDMEDGFFIARISGSVG